MSMPKAAMNQDGTLFSRKDDIRLARECLGVKTISIAQCAK
jgi:hypothetical protein